MTTKKKPSPLSRSLKTIRAKAKAAEEDGDALTLWRIAEDACDRIKELEVAVSRILSDWDSVDENTQVPDEINETGHWDALRFALREFRS